MDLTLPAEIDAVQLKERSIVEEHVFPLEAVREEYDTYVTIADIARHRSLALGRVSA